MNFTAIDFSGLKNDPTIIQHQNTANADIFWQIIIGATNNSLVTGLVIVVDIECKSIALSKLYRIISKI